MQSVDQGGGWLQATLLAGVPYSDEVCVVGCVVLEELSTFAVVTNSEGHLLKNRKSLNIR